MTRNKKTFAIFTVLFLGVLVVTAIANAQTTWQPPTAAFPNGQPYPPIDISDIGQIKTGLLGSESGLCLPSVFGGSVVCKTDWSQIGSGGGGGTGGTFWQATTTGIYYLSPGTPRVGIGTDSPVAMLDVRGNAKIGNVYFPWVSSLFSVDANSSAQNVPLAWFREGTRANAGITYGLYVWHNGGSNTGASAIGLSANSTAAGTGYNVAGTFQANGGGNNEGIRIFGVPTGPTNYAIRSLAPAQSYFAGPVGFGIASPTTTARLEIRQPGSGGNGAVLSTSATNGCTPTVTWVNSTTGTATTTRSSVRRCSNSLQLGSGDTSGFAPSLYVVDGGNVGVGNANPQSKLEVLGTANLHGSTNASVTGLYVDSNGSVGVNTKTPNELLQVDKGNVLATLDLSTAGFKYQQNGPYTTDLSQVTSATTLSCDIDPLSAADCQTIEYEAIDRGLIAWNRSQAQDCTIQASPCLPGTVVSVAYPYTRQVIAAVASGGTGYFQNNVVIGHPSIGSLVPSLVLSPAGAGSFSIVNVSGALRFLDGAGGARLTVLQNGNVGVGTTNPGYGLTVSGSSYFDAIGIFNAHSLIGSNQPPASADLASGNVYVADNVYRYDPSSGNSAVATPTGMMCGMGVAKSASGATYFSKLNCNSFGLSVNEGTTNDGAVCPIGWRPMTLDNNAGVPRFTFADQSIALSGVPAGFASWRWSSTFMNDSSAPLPGTTYTAYTCVNRFQISSPSTPPPASGTWQNVTLSRGADGQSCLSWLTAGGQAGSQRRAVWQDGSTFYGQCIYRYIGNGNGVLGDESSPPGGTYPAADSPLGAHTQTYR